jgi:hypothetical protein
VQLSEQQVIDLFTKIGEINTKLDAGPINCPVHAERIAVLMARMEKAEGKLSAVQTVIGKKELIVVAFGALGFGMLWALKVLAAWVGGKA